MTSSDAVNFTSRLSPVTSTLLSVKHYADSSLWLVTGTNGVVMKSLTGTEYTKINTYTNITDAIYALRRRSMAGIMAAGSGYVLTS